jgi:antirestriction protein ArdC
VRKEAYQTVTDKIVAALEQGVQPWFKPWSGTCCRKDHKAARANGVLYQGINVVMLWSEAKLLRAATLLRSG